MREFIIIKYKTLKRTGNAQKDFRKSAFFAYACATPTEYEAQNFINHIKSIHADANHNVSAYIIDCDNIQAIKYDDDGEPSGSAGKPVYRVLEIKGLKNAVVVVSRYFGGIKLGFGGLTRAYREMAVLAIEDAGIAEIEETVYMSLEANYSDAEIVAKITKLYGIILDTVYSDMVSFNVEIKSEFESEFAEKIISITKNRVTVKYDIST